MLKIKGYLFKDVCKVTYTKYYLNFNYISTLAATIDFRCLSYFDPKVYILKPKLTFFTFMLINVLVPILHCALYMKARKKHTLAKLKKFLVLPKTTRSAKTVENSHSLSLFPIQAFLDLRC